MAKFYQGILVVRSVVKMQSGHIPLEAPATNVYIESQHGHIEWEVIDTLNSGNSAHASCALAMAVIVVLVAQLDETQQLSCIVQGIGINAFKEHTNPTQQYDRVGLEVVSRVGSDFLVGDSVNAKQNNGYAVSPVVQTML